jgi:hypothetical protein
MQVINSPNMPPQSNPLKAGDATVRAIVPQNGMYALFMLCAVVGGFLMLLLTPQALAVPTLWIGGLLFFGLGALIDRVGAAINTLGASK